MTLVSTPRGLEDTAAILSSVMAVLPALGGGTSVWARAMAPDKTKAARTDRTSFVVINNCSNYCPNSSPDFQRDRIGHALDSHFYGVPQNFGGFDLQPPNG